MRKTGKKILAGMLAAVMLLSGLVITQTKERNVQGAVGDWNLVWSDEFNGTQLDESIWNYEIGTGDWGWGNNEQQYYRKENVTVSNGTMKITAKREDYGGKKYTSSRITTKNKYEFKYGKIEARIKLPRFKGIWPAFWMLGTSGGWPKCGEIDIMEAINDEDKTYGTLHWFNDPGNNNADSGGNTAVNDRTQWHTYSVIWSKNRLEWYVDDKMFYAMNVSDASFSEVRQNYYIIFNVAVGGQWPGYDIDDSAFPGTMEVDYVRVYEKEEAPTTEYTGPMIEVTEDAVDTCTNQWSSYFGAQQGWTESGATGSSTIQSTNKEGITMNISSIGTQQWGVQAFLKGLHYYTDSTYKYSFTMTSDVDKKVFVKLAGDGDAQVYGEYIDLKAGQPYNFERNITIPEDYEGVLDLYFGMGRCDGDAAAANSAANITISNVSFKTTTKIPDPSYVEPTTKAPTPTGTQPVTNATTPSGSVTTRQPVTTTKKIKAPAKTKIRSAKRTKNNKSIKIKLKKVSGATRYQIKYSTFKNFKKSKTVVTKKLTTTIKKLKAKKRYYIKARAYKVVKGKRYYGKWSTVKRVKVRK